MKKLLKQEVDKSKKHEEFKLMNDDTKKNLKFWNIAVWTLAFSFFALSLRWSWLDQSPPRWDESLYLFQASSLHFAAAKEGFSAFIDTLLHIDQGRVPLITLIVQPMFLVFGPSLDAAVITINLSWFLLAWGVLGLSKSYFEKNGNYYKLAFFTLLLIGLHPLTIMLSHYYLVELLLISFVCASMYSLWETYINGGLKWALLFGLFVGGGLLTKVTFPAFVLPSAITLCIFALKSKSWRVLLYLGLSVFIAVLIAGPYYLYNFSHIYALTIKLSSHEMAQLYGLGDIFSLKTILNYWLLIFNNITMILVLSFACIGLIAFILNHKYMKFMGPLWLKVLPGFLLGLWFIVPFLLATFGEIKDPRYVYPGLIPLFLLAAWGLSSIVVLDWGKIVVAVALIFPIGYFLSSNIITEAGSLPDLRNWRVREVVHNAFQKISNANLPHEVLFLGGNRYYHINLFKYVGLITGKELSYSTLPYYSDRSMNIDDAVRYVAKKSPTSILYKSGRNWPDFSSKLDKALVKKLQKNKNYEAYDLGVEQPDGSRFTLFLRTSSTIDRISQKELKEILSKERLILAKPVQFGKQYRLLAVTVQNIHGKNQLRLVWQSLIKQKLRHTNFIHLLNMQNKIVEQYDRALCRLQSSVNKGDIWSNTIELPAKSLNSEAHLGLGLYIPPSAGEALAVKGAVKSDWNGHRLIIELP